VSVISASQDYPLLNLFWTMLWLFIWVLWIFLLIRIISDIFRSPMSGFSKAMWLIFVILLPFLGVFVYLIARGDDMHKRELQDAKNNEAAFQDYVKQAAGSGTSSAEEITKLAALKDQGVLTEAEFQAQKAKLLA
jgi:hypothetical protein